MDELVDILDDKGNLTGRTAMKSKAHELGLFHATVHIWCYSIDGNILLQQRGATKDANPLKWDVSVAGHIGAGESPELGAQREVKEEIGVAIDFKRLEKIGVLKMEKRYSDTFFDREFTHTFLYLLDESAPLVQQESEVEDLRWISLKEFEKLAIKNDPRFVPKSQKRYELIINAIGSRLP